ncbi:MULTISPECIES: flagellin N-terminal helical domain-containing protein [Bacillus cereus group]|uniref:Flagellin n=2 Tax=Bacillus thuringiensis TaxID=1428 RepID=A0A1C4C5W9_BACTU|nr:MULTISPECIES: flagellin [Bacillus cereus group]MED2013959.1 flagellin [Bacillus wiedmannii]MED3023803.1 flagellin [Bacillus wiedmannii]OTX97158.1 flagellin [Bacillus thuringiensis serovar wratislaviensis]OUB55377.1 flagellin [Bacillus thuringiensis serovar sylvestriensis]SCC14510.1 Flagellin [Bacillus thuringiensis]
MCISTNVLSMNARQSLYENEKCMNVTMGYLATGKKLNHTSDNPTNVAIVTRIHAKANGMCVTIRNNKDAISMLRIAEAALQTVTNILQRMRDLAAQSANRTNSNRDSLNKEFQSLTEQIDYIDAKTGFNDLSVFDGQNRPVSLDDINHTVNITKHIPPSPTQHDIKISTEQEARTTIHKIEEALQNVSLHRADLGAMINRLQFNIENLNSRSIALTDASSQIEDASVAQEMSSFIKYNLFTEVALSMASQSNQIPQMVSKLLHS